MAESEFNPIAIYNNLINLRIKPQSGGKNANGDAQLVSNLRIDTASVVKEISRFRACDSGSCLYCREWASFIYKKNYTWTVKNQGQHTNENNDTDNAKTQQPKEAASKIRQQFCDLIIQNGEAKSSGLSNEMSDLVDFIVQKVFAWIKLPSSLYSLPNFFVPIEFCAPQQAITEQENELLILDAIEVEKSYLQIQKNSFPLLKSVSKIQQCKHTRPDWKNPSDLELDRKVFNDQLFRESRENEEALTESLGQVWSHVNNFLTSMLQLEASRDSTFGKGCVANLSSFLKEYQDESLPFNEYWAPIAEAYKKSGKSKKGPTNLTNIVEDIDTAFYTYINNARTVISFWEEGFIEKNFNDAIQFSEESQKLLISILVESEGRLVNGRVPEFHNNIMQKCDDALRTVKDIKLLVSKRVSLLRTELTNKDQELIRELEALEEVYKNESQKTLQGRLEKANNKEFRKRIKKFENAIHGARQYAINSIGVLFPVTDFTDICTRCLEILMMEGEMWEAVQLGRHYKNYEPKSKELESRRQQILKDYGEGVENGRKVLSGVIGRLFLKEAQRQQDETLALKKQESFLQSMGQSKQDSGKKKKGEKDQSSTAEATESSVSNEGSKKSKKKKRKNTTSNITSNMPSSLVLVEESEIPVDTSTSNSDTKNHEAVKDSKQQQILTNMISENDSNDVFKFMNSGTVSLPADSLKHNQTNKRQLSVPPGLSQPVDTCPRPIPNDLSPPSNGTYDDANKLNLDVLSKSDLIMLIQNLSTEKAQLVATLISMQQEVKAMTARYAKLVEVARDRELQTIQMAESRKQQELEEAKKYIQTLELRISQLEKHNSESTSPKSGSSPGSPIGISSTSQNTQFSLFPANNRTKYLNPWRSPTSGSRPFSNMRCGNCGDQGHVSQECTVGCRYCGNLGHLSENCESPYSNSKFGVFGGGGGNEENGTGVNTDKSDEIISPKHFNKQFSD